MDMCNKNLDLKPENTSRKLDRTPLLSGLRTQKVQLEHLHIFRRSNYYTYCLQRLYNIRNSFNILDLLQYYGIEWHNYLEPRP